MTLNQVNSLYTIDPYADEDYIWVDFPITEAGWRMSTSLQARITGGVIYNPTVTSATLAGDPAKLTVVANPLAYEWVPVSTSNPVPMGVYALTPGGTVGSFNLIFRYGNTDEVFPWIIQPPRFPFSSGATLRLNVNVFGYTKPPNPVTGYAFCPRVYFSFAFNVTAPRY